MSDDEFVKKVIELVKLFSADVIVEEMRVSRSTLTRWVQGRNLPHPAVREGFQRYYDDKKAFDIDSPLE